MWALTQLAACKDLEWQKKGRYFLMNAWNKGFLIFKAKEGIVETKDIIVRDSSS